MGSDHILLGTDYPTLMIDSGQVQAINGINGLSAEDREGSRHERRRAVRIDVNELFRLSPIRPGVLRRRLSVPG